MVPTNKRILIIDDDQEIWKAYQNVLLPVSASAGPATSDLDNELDAMLGKDSVTETPFEVSFAPQGQEGYALAETFLKKNEPFSLAFVDIRMPPGWDGMETAKRLHKLDPNLEIIIVTAYSDRSCAEIVECVGAPHKLLFFHKPFDPEELRQLAIALTDKWRIARQEEFQCMELSRLNSKLKTQMAEMEQMQTRQLELERMLHQAQKMEAIGLMAGGVAHDLNNILSGLVSYPELLLMEIPKESHLRKFVKVIRESGHRAAAVVADLLTVTRGAASGREIADLNTLISEYLQSPEGEKLKSLYPDVKITTNYASGGTNINCSPVHIKKSLMNLLTNAAEAIETSGTITIATNHIIIAETDSESAHLAPGEYVQLTVTDTGPGISPEDRDRIFEPFYTKKVMGRSGTGLGLAVVWNTMEDHKGQVTVESSDQGTTFTLLFQSTSEIVADKEEPLDIMNLKGNGTLLVVDDDALQSDLAREMLTKFGYNVHTVSSGEKAVDYLQTNKVDLVLLDMIMEPGMDGCQTYEKIIALHPGQKAIIVSGFSDSHMIDKAHALGVKGYVSKPFSMEQIALAVQKVLRG
ncbi:MAG: response regulator [Desulfobulbaceae bacterium]|nr:response regulator [Desulfobulbaceae bacterium]